MAQLLSFEEWKRLNAGLLTGLTPDLILEQYKKYELEFGKTLQASQTNPLGIDDNVADKKSTTNLQLNNNLNNIDLNGTTDILTLMGIATGNSTLTKAGILGSSAVKAMLQIKATKGMKGIDKTNGVVGAVGGVADAADLVFFGDLASKNSELTNGLNAGYDAVSSAVMTMGPYGALIGGAMKVGGLLSDGLTALGVGTDLMTTADQILDSKFLKLTPAGLVNGIFASSSDKFSIDNNVRAQIGGSYGGAYAYMDDAASKAGKKYGLFSSGARSDANSQIRQAKVYQGKIGNINKEAVDRRSIAYNSSDLLSTNYNYNLMGGYDQRYIRAAKEGSKLERIKKINLTLKKGGQVNRVINLETKEIEWKPIIVMDEVPEYKEGGSIGKVEWKPTIIENEVVETFKEGGWIPKIVEEIPILQEGGLAEKKPEKLEKIPETSENDEEIFTLEDYIEQKILERTQEAIRKATTRKRPYIFKNKDWKNCIATATDNFGGPICIRNTDFAADPGKWGFEEIELGDNTDNLPDGVLILDYNKPNNPNIPGHTIMLVGRTEDWVPIYSYSSGDNDAKSMHNGTINYDFRWDDKIKPRVYRFRGTDKDRKKWKLEYEELYKPFMKEGGKTKESEEEPLSNQLNVIPEGALHARLHHMDNAEELTKKGIPVIDNNGELLAEIELNEIIFNLEVTKKLEELCKDGSDEAAIEAGKLLVQEILFNTEDRTNLINSLKEGGKIDGNVS